MADPKKISQLTTAGPLTGAELVPVVQSGGTLQTTVSALKVFSLGNVEAQVSGLNSRVEAVSTLATQNAVAVASLQTGLTDVNLRVAAVSASVSVLNVQMAVAQASISALNVALAAIDASVIQSRIDAVSAATSVNAAAITSVNGVLATKVNRVGDYMDSVQYIEFDTSTVVSSSAGRLSWNVNEGTLDIGFDNQGVVLHTGLQLYERVYNNTYLTIPKGTVVKITGAQGQRLTAEPALADSDANSADTFAVMAETVSVNNSGFAVVQGILKNVDTAGINDGTILWLSPTSAGRYTPTKPVAPQHLVLVGYVVKGNTVGGGSIYVKIANGYELGELHDVKVSSSTSLANNEILAYNTSAGVWTNSTVLIDVQASVSALNVRMPVGAVVGTTDAQTLTNKRSNPRVFVTTTGVSVTPDISAYDVYAFTALAAAISVNPPVGTPVNGNKLVFRFKDNGVSRALNWATTGADSYRAVGITLPTATVASKTTYVGCIYNAEEARWDALAAVTQA